MSTESWCSDRAARTTSLVPGLASYHSDNERITAASKTASWSDEPVRPSSANLVSCSQETQSGRGGGSGPETLTAGREPAEGSAASTTHACGEQQEGASARTKCPQAMLS